MKKIVLILMMAGVLVSCSQDDPWSDYENISGSQENSMNGGFVEGGSGKGATLTNELGTFDVKLDATPLVESETIPDESDIYYEDYVECFTPKSLIGVVFSEGTATVNGSADGVTITIDGAHVTVNSTVKNVAYILSGSTSNGSFKIYSEKKFQLTLNGVSITNPNGAAINNQGKRAYVVVNDGTENMLADGTSYTMVENEDQKGRRRRPF